MLQHAKNFHHSKTLLISVIAVSLAACAGTESTITPPDSATSSPISSASSSSPQTTNSPSPQTINLPATTAIPESKMPKKLTSKLLLLEILQMVFLTQ